MVSFLSMGGDHLLDDLMDSTSLASQGDEDEESEEQDLLERSSESSISSKSGDSIVESGESDPEDSSGEFAEEEDFTTDREEESSEFQLSPVKIAPTKTPSKGRGVLPVASSDSLFGGVRKFFQRGKTRKGEQQEIGDETPESDSKKEIPISRTRRGGKRGEQDISPSKRCVDRTSTSDSLVGASRQSPSDPRRGVQRTSTSDSLSGVDPKSHTNPLHAAKTRRGGKRNKDGAEDTDASQNANDLENVTREPTRGVIRTSTTDSLGGVDPKKHNNALHAAKTRRGGKKSEMITSSNEETSESNDHSTNSAGSREPTRGVMRTSTSDSLGGVEQNSSAHANRTRRGGKRNKDSTLGEGEARESFDTSDSLDMSHSSSQKEPPRGVVRTSTSDSLTGVDPRKHTNAVHAAKTRRGGRRNRNDGDHSANVDASASADTSENSNNDADLEELSRGVVRTSTSDSLNGVDTKRAAFPRQTSKTRRGGRRIRVKVDDEEGDCSEGFDNSEYVADTSENASSEPKTRRRGRRNSSNEEESVEASCERVPRTSTVDSLLGNFGFERKRGVQRTSTTDSLTGLDSKKNRPGKGCDTTTPTTSDESTEGLELTESQQRGKTTVDKVLGAFGLQRGVARTSTSDSLTGMDSRKVRNKEIHASRTRRGGRRNRNNGEDASERSATPEEGAVSPQGKVVRTNTSDIWAQRLMRRSLPRTLTADSLEGADPNRHNNRPLGTKTRRGSRRPHTEEQIEFEYEQGNDENGDDILLKDDVHVIESEELSAEDKNCQ
ncbi:hypothetical protein FisN_2Lh539 [Fistulifera solaris]|uniref:Uncharacterized protein n=1 Tax=Fistulifera solaris TaxID=1519565 RepID=A0A1Z5JAJ9_FISSO|nr:hypothetical protein FisN_2Lh539 [Fistulifera solaris]|eukprot:GAX11010.1 hypothetical protein FisN_2Lh539 [Fistulifera solaris]